MKVPGKFSMETFSEFPQPIFRTYSTNFIGEKKAEARAFPAPASVFPFPNISLTPMEALYPTSNPPPKEQQHPWGRSRKWMT